MKINVITKNGYDLACALRGPDIKPRDKAEERFQYLLKAHTACRLRFLTGCTILTNVTKSPTSAYDRDKLFEYANEIGDRLIDYAHYICHAKMGARALSRIHSGHLTEMTALASTMDGLLYRIETLKDRAAKDRDK